MKIIVDSNEPKKMLDLLQIMNVQYKFGMKIEKELLPIGDYICVDEKSLVGKICIERKKHDDFVTSVMDGRLFNQAVNMMESFDIGIFIIIGNISRSFMSGGNNSKWGAVASLVTKFGINILVVPTEEVFAYTVLQIFKQCQTEVDLAKIRKPQISELGREVGAVSCANRVGGKLAEKVLKVFKIKDLAKIQNPKMISDKVKGIGLNKAKNILDLFQGYEDKDIFTNADIFLLKHYLKNIKRFNNDIGSCDERNLKRVKYMSSLLKLFFEEK